MREVHFRPSASDDLMRAYQAYRDLDDRDLAERLLHEVNEAFERLKLLAHAYQPSAFTPAGRPIRRMPLGSFPYMFVYIIDNQDEVQIIACPHVKQDRSWRFRER